MNTILRPVILVKKYKIRFFTPFHVLWTQEQFKELEEESAPFSLDDEYTKTSHKDNCLLSPDKVISTHSPFKLLQFIWKKMLKI